MNRLMPACTFAAACVFAVAVNAQDTTVKSKTKMDADDAHMVTMTGCLQAAPSGDLFILSNATMIKGEEMKSKSKTKIDRDSDETQVKDKSKTEIEHGEHVGTAGTMATYELMPGSGIDLTPHVGHKVQVTAVATEPGKGDADITARTETKVKTDDAPDPKVKSKTKMEMPRGANSRLTVMSVKHVAASCTM
jgi:hypothetical protein